MDILNLVAYRGVLKRYMGGGKGLSVPWRIPNAQNRLPDSHNSLLDVQRTFLDINDTVN